MGVREGYDQELLEVQTDILLMGETAILALEKSIQALVELDVTTAEQIMTADDVIDQMEIDIENKCVTMIARQQPLARDLRVITTGLKITTDLERIGDYAFDISRIVTHMDHAKGHIKPLVDIPRMSAMACKMVREALTAYQSGDLMLAQKVCQADDEVDLRVGEGDGEGFVGGHCYTPCELLLLRAVRCYGRRFFAVRRRTAPGMPEA